MGCSAACSHSCHLYDASTTEDELRFPDGEESIVKPPAEPLNLNTSIEKADIDLSIFKHLSAMLYSKSQEQDGMSILIEISSDNTMHESQFEEWFTDNDDSETSGIWETVYSPVTRSYSRVYSGGYGVWKYRTYGYCCECRDGPKNIALELRCINCRHSRSGKYPIEKSTIGEQNTLKNGMLKKRVQIRPEGMQGL